MTEWPWSVVLAVEREINVGSWLHAHGREKVNPKDIAETHSLLALFEKNCGRFTTEAVYYGTLQREVQHGGGGLRWWLRRRELQRGEMVNSITQYI